jgi:HPt (histidine-containing phosphotransfer) domain-containing protein
MSQPKKDSEAVLDTQVLEEMCPEPGRLDDPVLLGLIALFLREEIPRLEILGRLARRKDGPELARLAHKLAGSCAVIGARQTYRAAQAVEHAAEAEDWRDMAARMAALRAAWTRLQAALAHHKLLPA